MTRVPALDSVRGVLLVMMAINHIPSDLRIFTDQPFGYFSAAEGFVFLSGLLAGKIYTHRAHSYGMRHATVAALGRAFQIYRAHLVTIALVFGWCALHIALAGSAPPGSPDLFAERPLASQLAAALLIYRPGLFDILPLYCGSLLGLPLVLMALEAGRARTVLAVSVALWAGVNVFAGPEPLVHGLIHTGAIRFTAWQLLFVLGVLLGSRWVTRNLRLSRPHPLALIAAGAIVLSLAAARHGFIPLPLEAAWLTEKINLGPLRLFDLALVFYLVAHVVRAFPQLFENAPLELLGRHSLAVFTAHVFVAEVLLGLPQYFEATALGRAAGTAILVSAMFLTALGSAARSGASFANGRMHEFT